MTKRQVQPRFVGLVADDLTGANDSAVQFTLAGWDTWLIRHLTELDKLVPPAGCSRLAAVTTASRACTDEEAARRTAAAVEALAAAGVERLFLKIDSTVRGAIAGQVTGSLAAWGAVHPDAVVVICPAFPDHGRTVSGGEVLVAGVPVADSVAATDPVTPVSVSALDQLVPDSVLLSAVDSISDQHVGRRFVVDARTNEDLASIASIIDHLGPGGIAVGSAGLAAAMAARWRVEEQPSARSQQRLVRRVLVAVSSPHPVAQSQVAKLLARVPDAIRVEAAAEQRRGPIGIGVISAPGRRTPAADWKLVALAGQVATELNRQPYDAIVLVGGDGALAILDLLGAMAVKITGQISSGIPRGIVVGGLADGLPIVTKSGGFGDARSLLDIIDSIRTEDETSALAQPDASDPDQQEERR
ncbi:MAG: Permease of the drug/metabolite transporter (DMT) superfamily [uncultured Propionibacteriaceae bacterium]|uniref:Permease of the drug/metabolite transporter (DMT) superfamily n=1 Tax=uncultured Propionibacteriaceae bacterium TaxID=257457 RepID=A0A6J4N716_9ACTN|nr:MAG: Permease of the drug/metabolite transporter (DMT) superfamily [uncultured Propionibacteriaceae bacterium]